MDREELINRIKDCGQYLIDNAQEILGKDNYTKDFYLTVNFYDLTEAPYITISRDVIPDKYIERLNQ